MTLACINQSLRVLLPISAGRFGLQAIKYICACLTDTTTSGDFAWQGSLDNKALYTAQSSRGAAAEYVFPA